MSINKKEFLINELKVKTVKEIYDSFESYCKQGLWDMKDLDTFKRYVRKVRNEVYGDSIDDKLKNENMYLRKKLSELRNEINRIKCDKHLYDIIIDGLRSEIKNINVDYFNVVNNVIENDQNSDEKLVNVLVISDVHYGEYVNPVEINNINYYNIDVSKERHIRLFERNLEYVSRFGIKEMNLLFLGDIFSGSIHSELNETNEHPMTFLIVDYYKFIVGLLNSYKSYFDKINIYCVVGNHGRLTVDVKFKQRSLLNYEYIFYMFLKEYYSNDEKIDVFFDNSVVTIYNINGIRWKIEHGDNYKSGNSFVSPLGIVVRDNFKDKNIYSSIGTDFDVIIMGHWHIASFVYLQGSNIPLILNPSIIGPNQYSVYKLHSSFFPSSYSFICNNKNIIESKLIRLDK